MFRTRSITYLAGAAAVALSASVLVACGAGGAATAAKLAPTSAGGRATLGVASNGSLGKILVDSRGRTLYLFQKDAPNKSACFGACAGDWPPLRSAKAAVGGGLTRSKVSTITRSDGKPQVTYNGHPLYRFESDQKPGDAMGQGISAFGASWYAVSRAGSKVSGSGGGGGGYGSSGY